MTKCITNHGGFLLLFLVSSASAAFDTLYNQHILSVEKQAFGTGLLGGSG